MKGFILLLSVVCTLATAVAKADGVPASCVSRSPEFKHLQSLQGALETICQAHAGPAALDLDDSWEVLVKSVHPREQTGRQKKRAKGRHGLPPG